MRENHSTLDDEVQACSKDRRAERSYLYDSKRTALHLQSIRPIAAKRRPRSTRVHSSRVLPTPLKTFLITDPLVFPTCQVPATRQGVRRRRYGNVTETRLAVELIIGQPR